MKASKKDILKAIYLKCLDCSYERKEIKLCKVTTCALHPFRLGKCQDDPDSPEFPETPEQPKKTRKPMSEEHKRKLLEGRQKAKLKNS